MFTGLHSSNGQEMFKVLIAYGTRIIEGVVPDTCEAAGLRAACAGPAGCRYNSARCLIYLQGAKGVFQNQKPAKLGTLSQPLSPPSATWNAFSIQRMSQLHWCVRPPTVYSS